MILLNGHSLTAVHVIPAERMSLQLKERNSTASLTPESADGISVGDWLQDDREPGAGIVWRVQSIQQAYHNRTPHVQLEHAINTLKDRILFGVVTPADMGGSTTCTAKQAVQYILAQQSDWVLGTFDYNSVSNPYKFDGDTLFDALETVTNSLEDAQWTYDFTVYPFKLNIVQHSADVDSELRAGRNLITVSRTVDRSGMFTRFYPIGKDDLHVTGNYVEKNTATYGVISKTETDTSLETEAELTAWANEQLNLHAQPVVTVTADGLELSRATGEDLDALTLGRVCRVPLPEYNTTIQERIVEISYQDKINQPEVVRITLANSRNDVTKIIADALKRSGHSWRSAAREMDRFYQEMYSEDGLVHSIILQTSTMIRTEVGDAVSGIYGSVIEQTASYIRSVVYDTASSISQSVIEQTASYIRTEVASTASGVAWAIVTQTMSGIIQEVGRKSTVYIQLTDPNDGVNVLYNGDIWIRSAKRTWNEMADLKWNEVAQNKWRDYYGALQYVWKDGSWIKVVDEAAIVESATWVEQDSERYAILARQVDAAGEGYNSNLTVTAQKISSEVSTAKGQLYSAITQTATNIMLQVADKERDLQTSIEQTAERITISASAAQSSLYSYIQVTASNIRLEVADVASGLQSWIEQTPGMIEAQVSDSKTEMWGIVQITATGIKQLVGGTDGKGGWIGSAIVQTSTSIHLAVSNSKTDMYGAILVSASEIKSTVGGSDGKGGWIGSAIKQTSTNIHIAVSGAKTDLRSYIDVNTSNITLKANKTYVDGQLEGINAKFNNITVVEGSATYLSSGKVYATSSLHVGTGTSGGSGTLYFRGTAYYNNFIVMKNSSNTNICEATFLGTKSAANSFDLTHYHEISVTEGTGALAGKMVVTLGKPSSSEGSANFNIADTQTYKNAVSAAKNTVSVKPFTADARSSLNDHRTFTYETDAPSPAYGSEQVDTWYVDPSGWSAGEKYVYLRYGSSSGTAYARTTISMPSPSSLDLDPVKSSSSGSTYSYDKAVSISATYAYSWLTFYLGGQKYVIRVHPMSG